jgi:hypothetical protein
MISGWYLKVIMGAIYYASLTSCIVLQGLIPSNPGQPVTCVIDSGSFKLGEFSAVDSANQLKIQFVYTSAATYANGNVVVYAYGTSALYTADDFAAYATVAYTATAAPTVVPDITMSALPFVAAPAPGASGTFNLTIGGTNLGSSLTVAAGDYLRLYLDPGRNLLSGTSECHFSNTTLESYYGCTVNTAN